MALQRGAHPLDLGLVVVDLRVEAALEDQPPDVGHDVDEPPAPARGELVEDLARVLQRRRILAGAAPHGAQPGPEPARVQDLLFDQAGRLVPGATQPVLGPVQRERGPAGHVAAEVVRVFPAGGLSPALTQRADGGGLAYQQRGPAGLAGQDPLLLPFTGPVRVPARHQVGQPGHAPARVLLGQPGHPDRYQRGVVVTRQEIGGQPSARDLRRPEADQGLVPPAGRGDPLPDEPLLGRRPGLHQHHRARRAGRGRRQQLIQITHGVSRLASGRS